MDEGALVYAHGRLFTENINSTLAARQRDGTSSRIDISDRTALFPMPLPYLDIPSEVALRGEKRFEHRRRSKDDSAKQMVNLVVCLQNFYDADCPRGGKAPCFDSAELNPEQLDVARRYLAEAKIFCAESGGQMDTGARGRSRLNSMILALQTRYSESAKTMRECKTFTVAEDVIPDRISMPERGGHLRASELMCPERAKIF